MQSQFGQNDLERILLRLETVELLSQNLQNDLYELQKQLSLGSNIQSQIENIKRTNGEFKEAEIMAVSYNIVSKSCKTIQEVKPNKDIEDDIKCLKYEIKKLKKRQAACDAKCDELTTENEAAKRELECVKYELKSLKIFSKKTPKLIKDIEEIKAMTIDTSIKVDETDEKVRRLVGSTDDEIKKINNIEKENDRLKEQNNSMKYEIDKMKETQNGTEVAKNIELINGLKKEVESIKESGRSSKRTNVHDGKLARDVRCLKYEMRKIIENRETKLNPKVSLPQAQQIFVDLPQAHAVQLLFRTQSKLIKNA